MNQRVRVSSPQTRLALRRRTDAMRRGSRPSDRPPIASTAIDMEAGERALRRQRRLAARTAALLAVTFAVLLAAAEFAPGRLGWIALLFAPYPMLLVLAATHVRRAEHIEKDH